MLIVGRIFTLYGRTPPWGQTMKILAITCSLATFAFAGPTLADEYMMAMGSRNAQSVYFVDTTSITPVGENIYTAWEVVVFNGDNVVQGIKSAKIMSRFDCKAQTTQQITATYYDSTENALTTDSRAQDVHYVIPDSEGQRVVQIVCATDRDTKYAERKIGSKTPMQIADYIYANWKK